MTTFAIGIEYDGTHYYGWQSQQGNLPTIQCHLESALSSVANTPISIIGAGRTDKGVHATGQVAHFISDVQRTTNEWLLGSNTHLPPDIRINWCKLMEEDFHARFSAFSRRYHYIIDNRSVRGALMHQRAAWHYHTLDVDLMQQAANDLIGEHDFQSFRAAECQSKTSMRNLELLTVRRHGDFVIIDVKANAFLHHMVRNIAGVLMMIGDGRRPPGWAHEVLEAKDRTQAGITAPPYGLYMLEVKYPEHFAVPCGVGYHLG